MLDLGLPMSFGLAALGGYFLGSVPFGLVLVRLAGLGDIRAIGSHSIGATNVLRTGRKDLALATLFLDAGKAGFAYLIAAQLLGHEAGLIAGAAAFVGHCFPVWLKFQGGKGVATFFGLLFFAMWKVALVAAGMWLTVAFAFRFSSVAGLVAVTVAPIAAYGTNQGMFAVWVLLALAVFVYWRHWPNLVRLKNGIEPKIGAKDKTDAPA
jgi:glycerol-3-phosphate acyltransferase PlsY